MRRILVFGNSGSGKSTIASRLAKETGLAHLDLDSLAWQATMPPQRMPLAESLGLINAFTAKNESWVIEGCYADLLGACTELANEMLFLNLSISQCIENAKSRPWEPHKYESKEAQDANLEMLLDWIAQYENRDDVFSLAAHDKLFEDFSGTKTRVLSNEHSFV